MPEAVASPWGITSLQILFLLVGAVGGMVVLRKIFLRKVEREGRGSSGYPRWPVLLPVLMFLWLLVAR